MIYVKFTIKDLVFFLLFISIDTIVYLIEIDTNNSFKTEVKR